MTTTANAETRILIENVRWETYMSLSHDRRGSVPRLTYAGGVLELMSPKKEHETAKSLLGLLINAFCEIRQIDILSVASTTFHRQDLERGFEGDLAYYVEHAQGMRSREEIDLSIDPPPELVVQIEITSSAIAKLDLLAAMGVNELWRFNGLKLKVYALEQNSFRKVPDSQVLNGFPLRLAEELLAQRYDQGETSLLRHFRAEVGCV